MTEEKLEQKANESLMQLDFKKNETMHRITYQGNLELLRKGVYELFVGIYDSLRKYGR